jgi:hypothetical protein
VWEGLGDIPVGAGSTPGVWSLNRFDQWNYFPATQMTREEIQSIIEKYVNLWNKTNPDYHLWVALAKPGASITIPGVGFGVTKHPQEVAGMNVSVHAHIIVLRENMIAESLLTTFFHEYGHASYQREHPGEVNAVDSEMVAIRKSLELCVTEGFEDLAYREAKSIKEVADSEPYRSAVARLANDELWRKYTT